MTETYKMVHAIYDPASSVMFKYYLDIAVTNHTKGNPFKIDPGHSR